MGAVVFVAKNSLTFFGGVYRGLALLEAIFGGEFELAADFGAVGVVATAVVGGEPDAGEWGGFRGGEDFVLEVWWECVEFGGEVGWAVLEVAAQAAAIAGGWKLRVHHLHAAAYVPVTSMILW